MTAVNILHGLIVIAALALYVTAFTVVLCKAADAAARADTRSTKMTKEPS